MNLIDEIEAAAQRARDAFAELPGADHSWDDSACDDFQSTHYWPRIRAALLAAQEMYSQLDIMLGKKFPATLSQIKFREAWNGEAPK